MSNYNTTYSSAFVEEYLRQFECFDDEDPEEEYVYIEVMINLEI